MNGINDMVQMHLLYPCCYDGRNVSMTTLKFEMEIPALL